MLRIRFADLMLIVFTIAVLPTLVLAQISQPAMKQVVKEIPLPADTLVNFHSLHVATAADKAVYSSMEVPTDLSAKSAVTASLLDMKTGKVTLLSDAVKDMPKQLVMPGDVAPDGKSILLRDPSALCLLDLVTLKVTMLSARLNIMSCWVGKRVAISGQGEDDGIDLVKLVAPTGKSSDLPVRGFAMCASANGDFIVVAANAKVPTAKAEPETMQTTASMLIIDPAGKVLRELTSMDVVSSKPMLSPNGKYVTFQTKPAGAGDGQDSKYGVTVLSTDGKESWTVKDEAGEPCAVLDDGSVVCSDLIHGLDGTEFRLVNKKGDKIVLGKGADIAVVSGNVYLATRGSKPVIRISPLPR